MTQSDISNLIGSLGAIFAAIKIAKNITNIELSNYQTFVKEYAAAMFLPHTERRLFPSVTY